MAKKQFTLNTAPHEAEIGDDTFLFQPEVLGSVFLDNYEQLQEVNRELNIDPTDMTGTDLSKVREATVAMRVFLARLMLPESAAEFVRWDVVVDGETVSSHQDPDEARDVAAETDGATVIDSGKQYPDRVLVQLMEWVVELYGGGSSQRPPTSSNGSAPASLPPGRRGKAGSPSRASTSTRGR